VSAGKKASGLASARFSELFFPPGWSQFALGRTSRPEKLPGNFVSVIYAKRSAAPATWQKARGAQGIGGARSGSGVRAGAEAIAKPRKARFFCGEAAKKCAKQTNMTEKK
jgi:hypothetical protein